MHEDLPASPIEVVVSPRLRPFETYFDAIDTETKAYWLGFILADGCVRSQNGRTHSLTVGLGGIDIDHLSTMERDFGGSRTPRRDPRNGTVRLTWYSKYLVSRLMNLGIEQRKSGKERIPAFPPQFTRHFWRGVFDGDGCLAIQIKKDSVAPEYRLSLAGSVAVLEGFLQWAQSEVGVRPQRISRAKNSQGESKISVFFMNGNRQIAALTTALYHSSERKLARKYAIHLRLLEQNANTRPSYRRIYLV